MSVTRLPRRINETRLHREIARKIHLFVEMSCLVPSMPGNGLRRGWCVPTSRSIAEGGVFLSRRAIFFVVILSMFVFMASGLGVSQANNGPGSDCPPPHGAPVCVNGIFTPPGLAVACNSPIVAKHNKNCPSPPPQAQVCGTDTGETPADGPVSGIVESVASAFRDNGGGALADVLDAVACQLLTPLGL